MKLTPLDIHHKEFSHALRGYNEAEVDAFLDQVADELERLFKENIDLSEKNEALEAKVREYQDMERTLHNTLLSAQKSADEMMHKAQREAEVVLKDAEVKAKEVIHNALTSKQKATADLGRIKQAEEEFRGHVQGAARASPAVDSPRSPLPDDVQADGRPGRRGDRRGRRRLRAVPSVRAGRAAQVPLGAALRAAGGAPGQRRGNAAQRRAEPSPATPPSSRACTSAISARRDLEPDATMEFDVAEFGSASATRTSTSRRSTRRGARCVSPFTSPPGRVATRSRAGVGVNCLCGSRSRPRAARRTPRRARCWRAHSASRRARCVWCVARAARHKQVEVDGCRGRGRRAGVRRTAGGRARGAGMGRPSGIRDRVRWQPSCRACCG